MRIARVGVGIAATIVLLSGSAAQAKSAPTLGVKSATPNGRGFGQVRPGRIDFGGDATSIVTDIKWSSWGAARAVGQGKAIWVWPGWCVACGGIQLPATVVAFGRTTCHGHSAYSYVEWFFPSRGQSFDRRLHGNNICTGRPPKVSSRVRRCGQVRLRSAVAKDINMLNSPISCSAARQFVADSGAGRYLHRNARFTIDGWWCGSQLVAGLRGVQFFSCQRGDFANLNFELKPG